MYFIYFIYTSLCLKRKFSSCLPFVELVCAPELALLILKFLSRGLILGSAHLLTLLPPFLVALTLILSKYLVYLLLLLFFHLD